MPTGPEGQKRAAYAVGEHETLPSEVSACVSNRQTYRAPTWREISGKD
jgi:hypothetical protein